MQQQAPPNCPINWLDISTRFTETLERETSRGRVYRIRLGPGQATSLHRHAQPGLLIQISNGKVVLTGDASAASSAQSGTGAWWWREAGNIHSIRNASDAPIELVEIDWK